MRKLLCALSVALLAFAGCGDSENGVFTNNNNNFVVGGNSVANDDAYTTVGNGQISVDAQQGLLANDTISGDVLADNTQPANGTVTVSDDGSFTYNPNTGFRGGSDSFTYSLTNGSTATVNITLNGLAWFVDSSAGPSGDGSLAGPFTTTAQAQAASQPGDIIFLFFGNGSAYGPLTLQNNQQLVGQVSGLAAQTVVPVPGGRPVISNNSGDGVTLADGNTVTGVELNGTSGAGVFGSSIAGLTLDDVVFRDCGTNGVHVDSLSGTFTFNNLEARTSGDDNFFLANCSGTGTITNLSSIGAGDDGLDMESFSGTLSLTDSLFAGDIDDSVDFFETSGTVTIQRVRSETPGENSFQLADSMGGTFTIADCQMNAPGFQGICLESFDSGSLTADITDCTISDPGYEGIFVDLEDSADFDLAIERSTIDGASAIGEEFPGMDLNFYDVSGQILVLDSTVEFGFGDGVVLDQNDSGTVNALFDNNTIRENGQDEGRGMEIETDGGTLNVGITRNVFDNNEAASDLTTFAAATACVRFNDNDASTDDDEFDIEVVSGTINLEATSGNTPPPSTTGTTPVPANSCTDIPTR